MFRQKSTYEMRISDWSSDVCSSDLNVKALQSAPNLAGKRGGVVQDLKQELESIGYKVSSKVINSADFGVAQLRQRLFIVALRGDIEFKFPEPTRSKDTYKTVGEALAGLPKPVGKGEDTVVRSEEQRSELQSL